MERTLKKYLNRSNKKVNLIRQRLDRLKDYREWPERQRLMEERAANYKGPLFTIDTSHSIKDEDLKEFVRLLKKATEV